MIPPPPAPEMPLKTINCIIVFEKPAAKFPIMKIVIESPRAAFLPNMSLNLPYIG